MIFERCSTRLLPTNSLTIAPDGNAVGQVVERLIGYRDYWFGEFLDEDSGTDKSRSAGTEESVASPRSVDALAQDVDRTWRLIDDCLARWTLVDMRQSFLCDRNGERVTLSRALVMWGVLCQDLMYGAEPQIVLGIHGIAAALNSPSGDAVSSAAFYGIG